MKVGYKSLLAASYMAATMTGFSSSSFAAGTEAKTVPDWNGLWQMDNPLTFDGTTGVETASTHTIPGIPPGGRMFPPFNEQVEEEYQKRVAKAKIDGFISDRVADCGIHGMPRVAAGALPTGNNFGIIIVTMDNVTVMIFSELAQVRQIYTDGRPHTDPDYSYPMEMGHSIGRWEGKTLIIDTVYMMAGNYDQTQAPYSDNARAEERITELPDGTLESVLTIYDPELLVRPWVTKRNYKRQVPPADVAARGKPGPNWRNLPFNYCTVNRNARGADGSENVQLMTDKEPPLVPDAVTKINK